MCSSIIGFLPSWIFDHFSQKRHLPSLFYEHARGSIHDFWEKGFQGLTDTRFFIIMFRLSRCGEVWYRAWFGSKRPRVRIPTLRPKMKTAHRAAFIFLLASKIKYKLYDLNRNPKIRIPVFHYESSFILARIEIKSSKVSGRLPTSRSNAEG